MSRVCIFFEEDIKLHSSAETSAESSGSWPIRTMNEETLFKAVSMLSQL